MFRTTLLIRRSALRRHFSSSQQLQQQQQHYDAVIVGGGVVGLTMAKLLQEQCPRYTVALLDRGGAAAAAADTTIPHPRSYALSPKSLNLLGGDILSDISDRMGSYDAMQIWESQSPAMLVFSQHDLDGLEAQQQYLGACVEDSTLTSSLYKALEGSSSVTLHTKTALSSFKVQGNKVELAIEKNDGSDTAESSTITTSLMIAADGGQSPIRQTLGIPWRGLDYGRTAVTFTVELAKEAFVKRAYQRFLPHGPIALLPTYSSKHAVVVWSTTPEEALRLKGLETAELVERLNDTLQQGPQRLAPLFENTGGTSPFDSLAYGVDRVLDTIHYGMGMRHWSDDPEIFLAPPVINNVVSPKFTFPLSCKVASSVISKDNRIALIGDAAHTVHPLAGQGLNIGLEDVEALMRVAVQKSHDAGMDAAQFLPDYQSDRQIAIPAKVGGIHLLHSLFGMQSAPLKHGKSIGMSLVNQVGPLRRQLAKIATGLD